MTEKKAIAILEVNKLLSFSQTEFVEAADIAINALEHQIPQKPLNQGGIPVMGYCPRCNAVVDKASSPVGCKWCLQRVEWSDECERHD